VEAYAIGEDGRLTLVNRQELSLAATMPRHVAIAPDGRSLAVTAQGGGVFNTMPIAEDGSVGRASGILKVTGDVEGRPARPRMAIFDRGGRIVSADQGTGQLRVLRADDGLSSHSHVVVESGDLPRQIALHHEAEALYVAHESSLECYGYDHEAGRVTELRQRLSNAGVRDGAKALAVHPAGRLLLACDGESGVRSWTIGTDGTLRSAGRHAEELGRLDAMEVARDGARVSETRVLARVDSPRSLAVIYS
jgi:6-phosphogluconolactonase (cycloisomerase 2 family)